jgi:hypothetical protein
VGDWPAVPLVEEGSGNACQDRARVRYTSGFSPARVPTARGMRRVSTALAALVVCALVMLVAGCGGDYGESPERTPAQIENENEPGENENEPGENENERGESENEGGENEVDENEQGEEQEDGEDEPDGGPDGPEGPDQGRCSENPGECEPGS